MDFLKWILTNNLFKWVIAMLVYAGFSLNVLSPLMSRKIIPNYFDVRDFVKKSAHDFLEWLKKIFKSIIFENEDDRIEYEKIKEAYILELFTFRNVEDDRIEYEKIKEAYILELFEDINLEFIVDLIDFDTKSAPFMFDIYSNNINCLNFVDKFCQICILNLVDELYVFLTNVLPWLVNFYSHETLIWFNNSLYNNFFKYFYLFYEDRYNDFPNFKRAYTIDINKQFYADYLINRMGVKYFYFGDWCQYLLHNSFDTSFFFFDRIPECVLLNTKTSQKQIYDMHGIWSFIYEGIENNGALLITFSILEFSLFLLVLFLLFLTFFYKSSTMKNEEFASDAAWWANLLLVRQTEEELLLVEDNIFSLIIFIYLFGWLYCIYFNVHFMTSFPYAATLFIVLPTILYIFFIHPILIVYSTTIYLISIFRGGSTSPNGPLDLLYDYIAVVAMFTRTYVQLIRLYLLLFTASMIEYEATKIEINIRGWSTYISDFIFDFFKQPIILNRTTNIIITTPFIIAGFIYELGHLMFLIILQTVGFIIMVYWLYYYLYSCFFKINLDEFYKTRLDVVEFFKSYRLYWFKKFIPWSGFGIYFVRNRGGDDKKY